MFTFTINEQQSIGNNLNSRFLQSVFWAAFKSENGWTARSFSVSAVDETGTKYNCTISILLRKFRFAFFNFSIAYIPLAPELSPFTDNFESVENADASNSIEYIGQYANFLSEFSANVKKYLPENILCFRFDLPIDFYDCESRDFYVNSLKTLALARYTKIRKPLTDIQPPDTTILDLTKPAEQILASMKPKWRYNIRLAEKKGVKINFFTANSEDFSKAIDEFYALYKETASRDGIAIHNKSYYTDLFELAKKMPDSPEIRLYIASHEGDNLAGIITLFCKKEAVYLYGASGNIKRNLMPAYLLQWTAINDAISYGSKVYDFYGMPPVEDEHHPMYGLYRFKTGFGGKIIHRPGSVDVPANALYPVYECAERLRAFYHKRIKKILAGR